MELTVQTTGDILNEEIVEELLKRRVDRINVSGLDSWHEGLEAEAARESLQERLTRLFEAHGMKHHAQTDTQSQFQSADAAANVTVFNFYGAVPGSWIGALWPRGRAMENEVSTAALQDNFCSRRSGGIDFLQFRHSGSKVAIEPNGNDYPCCAKSQAPLGNVAEERLEEILQRRVGDPVYEAISMGRPERMGIRHGWSVEKFIEKSTMRLPSGKLYQNCCVGCDRFHEEVLMHPSALVSIQRGNISTSTV